MPENDKTIRVDSALSVSDHNRDASAMRYVYPVVSRRAGGVSIGINLNVNNACNWACIYCQVPNLVRGGPPTVDLAVLANELDNLLDEVLLGHFLERRVPEEMRRLADIAFSGNGEPTSSEQFEAAVALVVSALDRRGLAGQLPIRLITNGSLMHRPQVLRGLEQLGRNAGEVWFKIDRATEAGVLQVNQTAVSSDQVRKNLARAAEKAQVWIQTCWFGMDGAAPSDTDADAYIAFVSTQRALIQGVHLYGIARPSLQPDADRLLRLPVEALDALAARLKTIGVTATVSE